VGKGTTVERLEITQRRKFPEPEILLQGWKFRPRAGISARGQNFWGPEILEFPALRNLAKSFTERCGATLCKGARNSGLAEFPGGQKFHNFWPSKIRLSPLQRDVVQLSD
jgi:hypothetical protein